MSWPRPARLVAWTLLLAAAVGQVRVWSSDRGFWLDELSVAINLRERAWSELPGGLEYYQVAPVGWLAVTKALREWVGEAEVVLRLPSLVAGVALLVLTMVIARRAVGEWASAVAVGLVGFSPTLLYYSGELKQYAVETAVALGLLLLGDELLRRDPQRRQGAEQENGWRWPVLAAGAGLVAVAVTLSYSALIVLAGVTAGLAAIFAARRQWPAMAVLFLAAAPAAALGVGLAWYRRLYPLAPNQDTWFAHGMPVPGAGVGDVVAWLPQTWTGFVASPLGWRSGWWTLGLVAIGLVALLRRGRGHWAAMAAGVLAMAMVAAVLRGYPLADRVALYLVTPVILLVVAGVDGVARGVRWVARQIQLVPATAAGTAAAVVAAVAVVMPGPPVGDGVQQMLAPPDRDRGREVLADLAGRVRPGDVVIANWFAEQLGRWYGLEVAGLVRMAPAEDPQLCRPDSVDALLAGASRAWYLHGAPPGSEPADHTVRVAAQLAQRGRIVDAWTLGEDGLSNEPGWILLDLTAGPDPTPPTVEPHPDFACLTETEGVANEHQLTRGGRS
ncbi:hypothetical protein JQS43_17445 [Natronosporangium hydrolyticum]|uniref:Glycosyltransferase RgtA/B/C/D-like domain-containing protein n=1 Tax=Natronosporangium hydrolyticum TaxID=2811111 RepID=A0A895Y6M8_9ACTN|nr:DUF6541 family protein [Natronosporangium hydrolyticum]QSB13394.1 hypothetical protein JQS43_17445 [Natronosporangium hydrolyticum]